MTAAREAWLTSTRAAAASAGVALHILDRGEFMVTRGAVSRMVACRADLPAVLRSMGCSVEPEPIEVPT